MHRGYVGGVPVELLLEANRLLKQADRKVARLEAQVKWLEAVALAADGARATTVCRVYGIAVMDVERYDELRAALRALRDAEQGGEL